MHIRNKTLNEIHVGSCQTDSNIAVNHGQILGAFYKKNVIFH